MISQIKDFLLHLRLNYQIFILSGPYLLGVFLSSSFSKLQLVQFFTIHILLFGGVTAYNSFYDKDEGPIGGLKNPPKMTSWMLVASWILQIVGIGIALQSGIYFTTLYVLSMLLFWMYSSPHVRLKGRPVGSLVAIGLGTVVCAVFLGYYASGVNIIPPAEVFIAAVGSMFLVISMYPLSQVYQVEEDKKRGDVTFSVRYGKEGVRRIFTILFPAGVVLVSLALFLINPYYGVPFIIGGFIAGYLAYHVIKQVLMTTEDYKKVMRVKYVGGLLFSFCTLLLILLK